MPGVHSRLRQLEVFSYLAAVVAVGVTAVVVLNGHGTEANPIAAAILETVATYTSPVVAVAVLAIAKLAGIAFAYWFYYEGAPEWPRTALGCAGVLAAYLAIDAGWNLSVVGDLWSVVPYLLVVLGLGALVYLIVGNVQEERGVSGYRRPPR